jgi:molybdopterin molybdotransferase
VVPVEKTPSAGQVRDVNSHTLAALVRCAGGSARLFGIVADHHDDLLATCRKAVAESDMVLISGGSSVGTRDLTIEVLSKLPQSSILVHGISMRPGKPTILAQCGEKAFWGLPGHVTSAMVVFMMVVRPFIEHIGGRSPGTPPSVHACLTRNLASVQGRVDFVRVRLSQKDGRRWAEPVLGASGLIRTMIAADGLVAIPLNSEGLDEGSEVEVLLI